MTLFRSEFIIKAQIKQIDIFTNQFKVGRKAVQFLFENLAIRESWSNNSVGYSNNVIWASCLLIGYFLFNSMYSYFDFPFATCSSICPSIALKLYLFLMRILNSWDKVVLILLLVSISVDKNWCFNTASSGIWSQIGSVKNLAFWWPGCS